MNIGHLFLLLVEFGVSFCCAGNPQPWSLL